MQKFYQLQAAQRQLLRPLSNLDKRILQKYLSQFSLKKTMHYRKILFSFIPKYLTWILCKNQEMLATLCLGFS